MSERPPKPGLVGILPLGAARLLGRLATFALWSPVLLAAVEVVARPWSHDAWLPIWRTILLAGPGLAIALGLARVILAKVRRMRPGSVRVDGADLVVERDGDARRVPIASLRSGVVVPEVFGQRTHVEIELASGDQLRAEVPSIADGERLLGAAGIDAARRRCAVPLSAPAASGLRRGIAIASAIFGTCMALAIVLSFIKLSTAWIPVWLGLTTAAAWVAARVARAKSITIGADGLVVPTTLGERFVPFADVACVRAGETGNVAVELRDGAGSLSFRADADAARAIALRAEEARAARTDAPAAQVELLARGDLTLAAWRDAAARLVDRGGYRAARFSEDDLAALLASSEASAEHRIGAAFALAAAGDEHRARLRVAADACASPAMRVAIEKIAAGDVDEQAVEEALAAEAARERDTR